MNMSVRKVLLSPDHSIFAYNTEREGVEYGELHFKDLNKRGNWNVRRYTNHSLLLIFLVE